MGDMRIIQFQVKGLPPRKDGAQSMWGIKNPDWQRLVELRCAAADAFHGELPLTGNIKLTLHVHCSSLSKGDLANFIGGVCDGLQAAARNSKRDSIAPTLVCGDAIDAFRPIAYQDDKFVTSVDAQIIIASGPDWYEISLQGL